MHVNSFSVTAFYSIYCSNVEVRVYDNQPLDNNLLAFENRNGNEIRLMSKVLTGI